VDCSYASVFLYPVPSWDVGLWLGLLICSMSVMTSDYKQIRYKMKIDEFQHIMHNISANYY